jgi:hypothetical protein
VSRALSGREVPPWRLVERMAEILDVDLVKARRRWVHADRLRRRPRVGQAAGGPPAGLRDYSEFLVALRALLVERGLSHQKVVLRDQSGRLRRSTMGAVLRGERTAQREVVTAIVRACGVSDAAVDTWDDAWWRLGRPYQEMRHRCRREGYARRSYAEGMNRLLSVSSR